MIRAETEKGQSEFNMAVSYLGRLNFLFSQADQASINLDPHTWFHVLQAIYRELSTDIKQKDKDEWDKKTAEISTKLNIHLIRQSRTGTTAMQPDLYQALHQYEIFLRKTLDDAGLQTKRSEDAARALG